MAHSNPNETAVNTQLVESLVQVIRSLSPAEQTLLQSKLFSDTPDLSSRNITTQTKKSISQRIAEKLLQEREPLTEDLENSQLCKTIVERRGGHPQYLLQNAPTDLSSRETRKLLIAEHLEKRQQKRHQK